MPFIAVCPYCGIGRVRAPDQALGMTAPCPRCRTSFTLVDSGESLEVARERVKSSLPESASTIYALAPDAQVAESYTPIHREEPTIPDVADVPYSPRVASRISRAGYSDSPDIGGRTVVALFLAAGGLLATQIPFGRIPAVILAVAGMIVGLFAWVGTDRRTYLPATASIVNAILLLFVAALPGWLGMKPWRSEQVVEVQKSVKSFGSDGLSVPSSEWIDIGRAWQYDDVRAQVMMFAVGPVEVTDPGGKKQWTKQQYLHVRVRVGNVGVARPIPFNGWDSTPPKAGDPVAKMTDAEGRAIPPAAFEAGWSPPPRPAPINLLPTQGIDQTLYFQLPEIHTAFLRLELPGVVVGLTDSIRFQASAAQLPLPANRKKGGGS